MIDLNALNLSKPVIEFTKGIVDYDCYATAGMRARIVSVFTSDLDEVTTIRVSFAEFEAYNAPFELKNYFDKNGNPTLSAREAGFYESEEDYYVDSNTPEDSFFVVASSSTDILNEYSASGSKLTYVAWLETMLMEARKG